VIGLTLAKAKAKLRKAHCATGPVRRTRSRKIGRVIRQSPKPGAVKPRGFKVRLVVGRR
jgi:beta-lactam-binding protein with PASTA domain